MDKQQRDTLQYLRKVADRFGYLLNPDEKALDRISRSLTENKVKYGKYYCPCKRHYPLDIKIDPLCPCKTFKDEIAQNGHCECHIFFSAEAAEQFSRKEGLLATVTCPG
ncbi:MAG TPA: ferredoxin-thioredoxin reductase [Bacteroidetes bacterium]|nr:ferredoxin-thioredoxin reductase [Bacteroidota bacterium]